MATVMLGTERGNYILQQLQLQSTVKVTELAQQLDVSVDTVRRDLKSLEQRELVKCVRGGACLPESRSLFGGFTERKIVHQEEKKQAADKALALIKDGMLVAMNAGTTNMVLAQKMAAASFQITILTNNLAAANILITNPNLQVITVGGHIDPQEFASYGSECEKQLRTYYPDLAFLSINAVSTDCGYTDFRFNEISNIQIMAETSKQAVAVMDSSKLGTRSKHRVLEPKDIDLLCTDSVLSAALQEEYLKKGIHII